MIISRTIIRISLCLLLTIVLAGKAEAQYESGRWYLGTRISFLDLEDDRDFEEFSTKRIPAFQTTLDYAISRHVSAGVLFGFYRNSYTNDTLGTNKYRDYNLTVGALLSYHFAEDIERLFNYRVDLVNFDIYLTAGLRLSYYELREEGIPISEEGASSEFTDESVRIRGGPSLGISYYLNESFAMFVEGGYAQMGLISMGVSWKL